jgi:hypothetical protein
MGGVISGIASAIGAGLNDSNQQGVAQRNIAELQRAATLEDINAADSLQQGAIAAARARMAGSAATQEQRLAFTANGVDSTTGTAAQVAGTAGLWSELDALQAENNAARRAMGQRETGRRYRVQAQDVFQQADSAHLASGLGIAGGILSASASAVGAGMGGGGAGGFFGGSGPGADGYLSSFLGGK